MCSRVFSGLAFCHRSVKVTCLFRLHFSEHSSRRRPFCNSKGLRHSMHGLITPGSKAWISRYLFCLRCLHVRLRRYAFTFSGLFSFHERFVRTCRKCLHSSEHVFRLGCIVAKWSPHSMHCLIIAAYDSSYRIHHMAHGVNKTLVTSPMWPLARRPSGAAGPSPIHGCRTSPLLAPCCRARRPRPQSWHRV